MTSVARRIRYTPDEYLAFERRSATRHQLVDGQIYAMAGSSLRHSVLTARIITQLTNQLDNGPCLVCTSDTRVGVEATGMFTYPDVMVVCETGQYWQGAADTIVNPTVIVEVLSKSTEGYDRGLKFSHYQRIASLKHYVVVSQDRVFVEVFSRDSHNEWRLYHPLARLEDSLSLPAIGCEIPLRAIYHKVQLDVPEGPGDPVETASIS